MSERQRANREHWNAAAGLGMSEPARSSEGAAA